MYRLKIRPRKAKKRGRVLYFKTWESARGFCVMAGLRGKEIKAGGAV